MGRGPGFCPRCGERVSPFAAGCALCGADLDVRRHQPPRFGVPTIPLSTSLVVFVVVLALVTLLMPLLGVLVCGWVAYDRDRQGVSTERNIALAFAILAFFMFISPTVRLGVLQPLGLV